MSLFNDVWSFGFRSACLTLDTCWIASKAKPKVLKAELSKLDRRDTNERNKYAIGRDA